MEQRAYATTDSSAKPSPADKEPAHVDFSTALGRYRVWCDELAAAIADYQSWIEQQGEAEGEQDLRVYELIETIKDERLKICAGR